MKAVHSARSRLRRRLTLFAFLGVESAAISSGRLRNPDRNVGRASMLGTMLTVVVYLLGSVAIMGAIPPVLLMDSSAPFAEAAGAFWGEAARPDHGRGSRHGDSGCLERLAFYSR